MAGDKDTCLIDAGRANGDAPLDHFSLSLNAEEAAAVEGWRSANKVSSTENALRELVRLGLLSELSQAYDVVKSIRKSVDR